MKKVGLLIAVVVVWVLGIGMTAKAASFIEDNKKISKEQYEVMEKEYVEEVRLILLEKGCKHAGVTLTYIMDAEENRTYKVTVHHEKLEKMNSQEVSLLEARMQEKAEEMLLGEVSLKLL